MMEPGKSTCNKCGSRRRYKGEAGLLFCKSCDEWLAPECFPDRPIPVLPDAEARVAELEALATDENKGLWRFWNAKAEILSHAVTMLTKANDEAEARAEAAQALLKEAGKALEPFSMFAQVVDTSGDERGHSSVRLYAGKPPTPNGRFFSAEESEIELDELMDDEACLFGTVGVWRGVAASFMCPVIQAKHLRAARAIHDKIGVKDE